MYPSLVDENSPVVRAIGAAFTAETGKAPDLIHLPNAFDQGYLNHLGIPTVNFGCGEYAFAHTRDDLASIDRTIMAARVFARLIKNVCEKS
jgi:acetylornithine deacetylase/succinyl-diaminopimelate desuccinylase-like protein